MSKKEEKSYHQKCDIDITKLQGQNQVHEEKIVNHASLIRKNNHRAEKAVAKLQRRIETDMRNEKTDLSNRQRNTYYVSGFIMGILMVVFGLFQSASSETQKLLQEKIDKNEERISVLISESSEIKGKLEAEIDGLKLEIADRKVYSQRNDTNISEIRRDIANHNANTDIHHNHSHEK